MHSAIDAHAGAMARRRVWLSAALAAALSLAGCASLSMRDPPRVFLVGIDPLPGAGLELRLAVKLRVQNPNDAPIDFDGVALDLEVRGLAFASGVSSQRGSVPRFGETVVSVPVTVSAFALVRQAFAWSQGNRGKLDFVVRGKVSTPGAIDARFTASGEFDWPVGLPGAGS